MGNKPEEVVTTPIIIDPNMLGNYYKHDDEISLVDLWKSLVEQKKVFFASFLIIFIAGITFSSIQPTVYEYSTTIEIGTKADKETLIQATETVKSEIESAYSNIALHNYYKDKDKDKGIVNVSVNIPKNTNLIILKSSGTSEQSKAHLAIQNDILQRLIKKHNATSQSIQNGFSSKLLELNNKLDDLQNKKLFASKVLEVKRSLTTKKNGLIKLQEEKSSLDDSLIRIQSLADLLKKQYNTDIENLKTALKNQHQATKGRADTALLVLLTSELQQYRTHIAALNERLNIKLPAEQENLSFQIANNKRAQENQRVLIKQAENAVDKLYINRERQINLLKSQILKIKNDIKALPTTHALLPPSSSFEPVNGKKKLLIIAVSGVLGFFVALFAALFAGLLTKAKEKNE